MYFLHFFYQKFMFSSLVLDRGEKTHVSSQTSSLVPRREVYRFYIMEKRAHQISLGQYHGRKSCISASLNIWNCVAWKGPMYKYKPPSASAQISNNLHLYIMDIFTATRDWCIYIHPNACFTEAQHVQFSCSFLFILTETEGDVTNSQAC